MIYWHLPNPDGSCESTDGRRCSVYWAETVDFPQDFTNVCEAAILSEALTKLGLTLVTVSAKRYSQFALKEELVRRRLWDSVRNAMTDDEYENFILADFLAADHPLFTGFLARLQISDREEILKACKI